MSGPEPTWPSVQPRARPRRRSSAASSDTSPVRSTGSSLPRPHIAPRFQGLDEHRSITTSAWKTIYAKLNFVLTEFLRSSAWGLGASKRKEGDVVLLLPPFPHEGVELL